MLIMGGLIGIVLIIFGGTTSFLLFFFVPWTFNIFTCPSNNKLINTYSVGFACDNFLITSIVNNCNTVCTICVSEVDKVLDENISTQCPSIFFNVPTFFRLGSSSVLWHCWSAGKTHPASIQAPCGLEELWNKPTSFFSGRLECQTNWQHQSEFSVSYVLLLGFIEVYWIRVPFCTFLFILFILWHAPQRVHIVDTNLQSGLDSCEQYQLLHLNDWLWRLPLYVPNWIGWGVAWSQSVYYCNTQYGFRCRCVFCRLCVYMPRCVIMDDVGCHSQHLVVYKTVTYFSMLCLWNLQHAFVIIIIITTTIFIVLSSTALAICESSLWFLWAKVGQRQVAANS